MLEEKWISWSTSRIEQKLIGFLSIFFSAVVKTAVYFKRSFWGKLLFWRCFFVYHFRTMGGKFSSLWWKLHSTCILKPCEKTFLGKQIISFLSFLDIAWKTDDFLCKHSRQVCQNCILLVYWNHVRIRFLLEKNLVSVNFEHWALVFLLFCQIFYTRMSKRRCTCAKFLFE